MLPPQVGHTGTGARACRHIQLCFNDPGLDLIPSVIYLFTAGLEAVEKRILMLPRAPDHSYRRRSDQPRIAVFPQQLLVDLDVRKRALDQRQRKPRLRPDQPQTSTTSRRLRRNTSILLGPEQHDLMPRRSANRRHPIWPVQDLELALRPQTFRASIPNGQTPNGPAPLTLLRLHVWMSERCPLGAAIEAKIYSEYACGEQKGGKNRCVCGTIYVFL